MCRGSCLFEMDPIAHPISITPCRSNGSSKRSILWNVRSRVTGGEAVRGSICKVEANCGVIGSIG